MMNSSTAPPTAVSSPAVPPTEATNPNPTGQDGGSLLALGVTLEQTTACLLENIGGIHRLAGWATLQREPGASLAQQGATVCNRLGGQLGRVLWDEAANTPWLASADPVAYPPVDQVVAALSPRRRLRVWLVGLTAGGSLSAARRALSSAPLQLVGVTALTAALSGSRLAAQLVEAQPEALVITGGYDNPDPAAQQWLLQLCHYVGQALTRLAPAQRPAVFYAGNRWAGAAAEGLLRPEGGGTFTLLANILPQPQQGQPTATTELAVALNQLYWRLCQRMPGYAPLSRWVTAPGQVVNLEACFARLVQIWMSYYQLPTLHGLYCTPSWWLHVCASGEHGGVRMRFVKPQWRPPELDGWPPLQLVSGMWPMELWPPVGQVWWDRTGLAPLVTAVGQVAPLAMLQVLENDLLERRQRRS